MRLKKSLKTINVLCYISYSSFVLKINKTNDYFVQITTKCCCIYFLIAELSINFGKCYCSESLSAKLRDVKNTAEKLFGIQKRSVYISTNQLLCGKF